DLVHEGHAVVLSLFRHGERESWVLTAFEEENGGSGGAVGGNPSVLRSEAPGVSTTEGAEPEGNVGPEDRAGKREIAWDDEASGDTLPPEAEGPPGANYRGFVSDKYAPDVPGVRDPLRREGILRDLAKALGAPYYSGHFKGRRVLGFYRSGIEEIRLK